jgi:hypothetical protein
MLARKTFFCCAIEPHMFPTLGSCVGSHCEASTWGLLNRSLLIACTYNKSPMEPISAVVVDDGPLESEGVRPVQNAHHDIPVATAVPFRASHFGHLFNGAAAVQVLPDEELGVLTDRQRRLLVVYQLSRWIRVFAIIETVFVLIFGAMIPYFLILLPFPICGILGCRYWSYRLIFIYIMYLILDLIGGAASVYLLRHYLAVMVFRLIYTIGNAFVIYFAARLGTYMLAFEDSDRNFLLTSDVVKSFERHHGCC